MKSLIEKVFRSLTNGECMYVNVCLQMIQLFSMNLFSNVKFPHTNSGMVECSHVNTLHKLLSLYFSLRTFFLYTMYRMLFSVVFFSPSFILFIYLFAPFCINLLFQYKYSIHTRWFWVCCGMAWHWTKHKPNYYHIFFFSFSHTHIRRTIFSFMILNCILSISFFFPSRQLFSLQSYAI